MGTAAGEMTLIGNISSLELLLGGTPAQVAKARRDAMDGGVQNLSPECAFALTTPLNNLQTLVGFVEGKL
jgi:uroporphyrinogen-III decarboxylase